MSRVATVLVAVEPFDRFDLGADHPLKMFRLKLTYALIEACGLTLLDNVTVVPPRLASEEEVLTFHTAEYLHALKRANAGIWFPQWSHYAANPMDCPIFPGVYDASMLACGASAVAAEQVLSGKARIAFNMAGGLHHAFPSHASGFCYLNDPVVAINRLLEQFDRVAYVDIDAHHGDGVQYAYYGTQRVLTVSTHEYGVRGGFRFFPGTGSEEETGEGEGEGFAVNVPFPPMAGDDLFLRALNEIIAPLLQAYDPDVLVTQLGVDTLRGDLITDWQLTTHSYVRAVELFRSLEKPWVALGGGGYNIANVVRGWTLAWALMNDVEVPDEIPPIWFEAAKPYGVSLSRLLDEQPTESSRSLHLEMERVMERVKRTVFPRHRL